VKSSGLAGTMPAAIPGPGATVTCPTGYENLMVGVPAYADGAWGGCVLPGDDIAVESQTIPGVFWGCCDYQTFSYSTCGINKAWGDILMQECISTRAALYELHSCTDNATRLALISKMTGESEAIYNASQLDSCWCTSKASTSYERDYTPMDRCRLTTNAYDKCLCWDDTNRTQFREGMPKVSMRNKYWCETNSGVEFPAGGILTPGTTVSIKEDPALPEYFWNKVGHIVSLEWMNHFEGEPGHAVRSIRTGKAILKPTDLSWDTVQKKTLGPVLGTHAEWVSRGGYIVRIPWMDTEVGITFHPTFDQVEVV